MQVLPSTTAGRAAAAALGRCVGVTTILVLSLLVSLPPWLGPSGVWIGKPLGKSPPLSFPSPPCGDRGSCCTLLAGIPSSSLSLCRYRPLRLPYSLPVVLALPSPTAASSASVGVCHCSMAGGGSPPPPWSPLLWRCQNSVAPHSAIAQYLKISAPLPQGEGRSTVLLLRGVCWGKNALQCCFQRRRQSLPCLLGPLGPPWCP